jgi:hypothetical protein
MLHQQRVADVLENGAAAAGGAALFGQSPRDRLNNVVFVRRDFDLNGFFLVRLDRPDDPAVQSADDLLFFEWRHADRDHHAIAE